MVTGMKEDNENENKAIEVVAGEEEVGGVRVHGIYLEGGPISWYRKIKCTPQPLRVVVMPPV